MMKTTMQLVLVITTAAFVDFSQCFSPPVYQSRHHHTTQLSMNWFEKALGNAFSNQEYPKESEKLKASARHILIKDETDLAVVQEKLQQGSSFSKLAEDFSACPSGRQGGMLGRFGPGTMVKEFDDVVFDPATELGQVVGPVQTQFGYHFIVVDDRTGM